MIARTSGLRWWMASCLIAGLTPVTILGETRKAADLTPEAVAAAIEAAQDGDTVILPAGKAAWTKGWNTGRWAPMKAITIQGAGIDKTVIVDRRSESLAGDAPFWIKGVEDKPFRLTGLTIDGSGCKAPLGSFLLEIGGNCKNFRVDHCKFKDAAKMIRLVGDTYGLIDHCKFEATEPKNGLVQTVWYEGPGLANYAKPLSLGSAEALYFEDNEVLFGPEVVNPTGNNPWIVPYGGARIVIRHNKIVNSQLEIYRDFSGDLRGSQSAEIYDNEFSAVGLKQFRPQGFIFIGAGVNIVFNNTVTGTTYNGRAISLRNERAWRDFPGLPKGDGKNPMDGNQIPAGQPGAGYPHFGQVGWATKVDGKFAPTPCYAWNNTFNGKPLRMEVDSRAEESELATIKEGREFFNEKPPAEYYTPYIYPHPLQGAAAKPAANPVSAAPICLDLWPGMPPGDVGIEGEERARMVESALLDKPTKVITNISRPTLTVYPASEETNTGTAMIICPGGGYHDLYWELEGEEVAALLNAQGMTGIILKYRVPRRPGDLKGEPPLGPLIDAQRAVSLVRDRCHEWGVDPKRIGIVGFSAGGHLAVATAANFDRRRYEPVDDTDKESCRPDFAVGCYSGYFKAKDKDALSPAAHITPIPAGMPPVLLAHASDDTISDPEHSVMMYLALKRAGAPAELHVFSSGEHDFGVRHNEKLPSIWPNLCLRWLRSLNLPPPLKSTRE